MASKGSIDQPPLLSLHQLPLFPPPPSAAMPDRRGPSPAPGASEAERELSALYGAVLELSEQLDKNRAVAVELGAQAGRLRTQAGHAQAGFPLRRFNLNLDDDTYLGELQGMTRSLQAQNSELAQDNRALSNLIREHEATLDVVMAKFRAAAHETQDRELALTRKYETALLAREAQLERAVTQREGQSRDVLSRLNDRLRRAWRSAQGEPSPSSSSPSPSPQPALSWEVVADDGDDERTIADWSLERECELARLERENAELRRMMGRPVPGYPYALDADRPARKLSYTYPTAEGSSVGSDEEDVFRPPSAQAEPSSNDPVSTVPIPGSPEVRPRARLRDSTSTVIGRVASPFPGTGGAMGIGLRVNVAPDTVSSSRSRGRGSVRPVRGRRNSGGGGRGLLSSPVEEDWAPNAEEEVWRGWDATFDRNDELASSRRDVSREVREALLS